MNKYHVATNLQEVQSVGQRQRAIAIKANECLAFMVASDQSGYGFGFDPRLQMCFLREQLVHTKGSTDCSHVASKWGGVGMIILAVRVHWPSCSSALFLRCLVGCPLSMDRTRQKGNYAGHKSGIDFFRFCPFGFPSFSLSAAKGTFCGRTRVTQRLPSISQLALSGGLDWWFGDVPWFL